MIFVDILDFFRIFRIFWGECTRIILSEQPHGLIRLFMSIGVKIGSVCIINVSIAAGQIKNGVECHWHSVAGMYAQMRIDHASRRHWGQSERPICSMDWSRFQIELCPEVTKRPATVCHATLHPCWMQKATDHPSNDGKWAPVPCPWEMLASIHLNWPDRVPERSPSNISDEVLFTPK